MARGAWLLITVGTLLSLASQAGAAEFMNPYGGGSSAKEHRVARTSSNRATTSASSEKTQQASSGTTSGPEAGAGSDPPPAQAAQNDIGYKIGPLDVLDISVFQVPELSKTVQVAANGNIELPLIGETPAAGKTVQELQRDINARLGADYVQNPDVTVVVKDAKSSSVTVTGAVAKPGMYQVTDELTLLQLITQAGWFTQQSDSTALILRKTGGKRIVAKFDVSEIQYGKARDPRIRAGDQIVAGESEIKKTLGKFDTILKYLGPLAFFGTL
jgi:polysaccharide biosynthesis/export protein